MSPRSKSSTLLNLSHSTSGSRFPTRLHPQRRKIEEVFGRAGKMPLLEPHHFSNVRSPLRPPSRALAPSRESPRLRPNPHITSYLNRSFDHLRDVSLHLRDASPHLRDVFGHLREPSPHFRDVFGHLRELTPHLWDVFGHLSDVCGTQHHVSPHLREPSLHLRDVFDERRDGSLDCRRLSHPRG